jgi:hypothetical protein
MNNKGNTDGESQRTSPLFTVVLFFLLRYSKRKTCQLIFVLVRLTGREEKITDTRKQNWF